MVHARGPVARWYTSGVMPPHEQVLVPERLHAWKPPADGHVGKQHLHLAVNINVAKAIFNHVFLKGVHDVDNLDNATVNVLEVQPWKGSGLAPPLARDISE